ncbi:short-subunit dehydrogenase [Hasllibacter halocynthiae]|uniref:Short-subunit dehydrogenase n=1 Tax=Hasllibacter halocynthiae TaxID=595589 RepID=A0A2T0X3E2_9RHOB|nr:SDR family NAD(P)-dependent oxidoreductase [Hasllibacter halocynthiae]PRY93451.1 short-subunit dehydrogenase [Hasllibacter halocynthiae]
MRTILVTGCSSGIGHHAAHALAARGWRVLATCRQPRDCGRLRAEGLESFPLDQGDETSVARACEQALDLTGGRLDALFANGAHATPGFAEDLPRDALRAIFEANLFGVHDLTRRLIPALRAAPDGRAVWCSSVLGFAAMPWRGAYNSTKHAMEGLADTLRLECRETGPRVILIQPGPIATRIRTNSVPHFERWIDPGASARAAEYARLQARLRAPEPEVPEGHRAHPGRVTRALLRALDAPRPRARYRVTRETRLAEGMRRLLPTALRDALLSRAG